MHLCYDIQMVGSWEVISQSRLCRKSWTSVPVVAISRGFSTRSEVLSFPSMLPALQAGTVHGKVLPSVAYCFYGEVGNLGLRLNKEIQHHHTRPFSPPLCFGKQRDSPFLSQTAHRISLRNISHDDFLKGSKPCNKGVSFNESGGWQGSREAIVRFG